MKAKDVILQLMDRIPRHTELFTDKIQISSITSTGTTATATTASSHGRSTGDVVNILGAKSPISITSMTRVGEEITCVTNSDHDLTENYQESVTIQGANEAEFNGEFPLIGVPNRRTFNLQAEDSGATTATGSPIAIDASSYGYNGLKQITVLNATQFTYSIDKELPLDAAGNPFVFTGYRISGSADIDQFIDAYTSQDINEFWLCVVLGDTVASKDRDIQNDATSARATGVALYQKLVQPVSIYCIAPTTQQYAGRDARDDMEDIMSYLCRSMLGARFNTYLTAAREFQTTFVSHGIHQYIGAYYVHEFNFESIAQLTYGDSVGEDFNVAFRDIDFTMGVDVGSEELTGSVNLDDEPLP